MPGTLEKARFVRQTQALSEWVEGYRRHGPPSSSLVEQALDYLTTRLAPGQDDRSLQLVLEALRGLERLSPDVQTVAATLLLPVANEVTAAAPEGEDWQAVGSLLEQLHTITRIGREHLDDNAAHAEGLRRLLLALIADTRVVLIALAWQLARLRGAGQDTETERLRVAREARLIHAPLANRLGIWQLKWELEDLAFLHLEPNTYRQISQLVAERRSDREAFIAAFIEQLKGALKRHGIAAEVSGRAKHIYSIWRKMQRKGLDFHELFDVRAVRVLVDSVSDCYSVLGLVHTQWQPVPGEFDDYITNPKANLYQSLHTAVSTAGDRVIEVQIRTHDMHQHAELGVAAHWRYKEGGPRDPAMDKRIGVMRRLLDGSDADDDESFLESFHNATTEDRVYVLTPRGEVRDLAAGATPLDFAYLIHTDIGHRCRGARVNGRIVPLTTALKNGDRVEILTAREPQPSRDWMVPRLGYIRTARARSKVRHWFRQAHYDDHVSAGRQAVETEFKRLDLDSAELTGIIQTFNFKRVDDLLAAVGCGDLTPGQLAGAIERRRSADRPISSLQLQKPDQTDDATDGVRIEGVGRLLHQLARCCQPVPGDAIGGYITRGRGVAVHRQDCKQFRQLGRQQPERILEVNWAERNRRTYPARIRIDALDRRELIKDIGGLLATEQVNLTAMKAASGGPAEPVSIDLTVQVEDFEQLSALLGRLQGLRGVTQARRVRDG